MRHSRTLCTAALLLLVACMLLLLPATPALAKSYTMPSVNIDASVAADGTLQIREERVFDFDGSFSWVEWLLNNTGATELRVQSVEGPTGAYTLTDYETGQPGTYTVTDEVGALRVRVFHDTADAQARFVLNYVAVGAAKRYSDTAELNWQFIGNGWDVGVGSVDIQVTLPPGIPATDIKAYAHGPLTGIVEPPAESLARFTVEDLPPGTFVETRILFPEGALAQAGSFDSPRLDEAVAQETRWAEEANAKRRAARTQIAIASVIGGLLPLAAALGAFALWWRHGRERKPQFPGGYFREVPSDLPPALVGALWRFGTTTDADTVATIMDLTNRGVIGIERVTETKKRLLGLLPDASEETYQLTLAQASSQAVHPFERRLIQLLFTQASDDGSLTMSELKAWAKAHPQAFTTGMTEWKAGVTEAAAAHGFFDTQGGVLKWVFIAGAVFLFMIGIGVTAFTQTVWPALAGFTSSAIVMVLGFLMPRRTAAANELYWKYRGLRDYLRDFSRLNEAPPTHVVLWEHFIVMAVVFGIAEQVIEALRVRVPEIANDPTFARTAWWVTAPHAGGVSPMNALSTGFTSAAQVATSQMSSSSGGGGGFSGGGAG